MERNENAACPYCGNEKVNRIRRHSWMRIIPFSELYDCPRCRGEFMIVLSLIRVNISYGLSKLININSSAHTQKT